MNMGKYLEISNLTCNNNHLKISIPYTKYFNLNSDIRLDVLYENSNV